MHPPPSASYATVFLASKQKKKGEEKGRIFAQPSSDLADNDIVAGLSSLRTVFDLM